MEGKECNILLTTCEGDGNATPHAREWTGLYKDIAGVTVPQGFTDPIGEDVDAQNAAIDALTAQENVTGLYWLLMKDGSHMQTFIYGPKLDAGYRWLLQQTKASEDEREKLEALNRAWAAETDPEKLEAAQTEDRIYYVDSEGNPVMQDGKAKLNSSLSSSIDLFGCYGGTYVSYGMAMANQLFDSNTEQRPDSNGVLK